MLISVLCTFTSAWRRGKAHTFYTYVNGKRANIGAREGPYGKYLETYADGYWNNNLLSVPEYA